MKNVQLLTAAIVAGAIFVGPVSAEDQNGAPAATTTAPDATAPAATNAAPDASAPAATTTAPAATNATPETPAPASNNPAPDTPAPAATNAAPAESKVVIPPDSEWVHPTK